MSISVERRGARGAPGIVVYIGRPSTLGNPFVMKSEADRDAVCDRYEQWLRVKIEAKDERVLGALREIYKLHKQGHVVLTCYCAPKRCHGDSIKRWIEEQG